MKTFDTCFPEVIDLMENFSGEKFKPDWNYIIPIIHNIESMGYIIKINKIDEYCHGTIYLKSDKITEASVKCKDNDVSDRFKCSVLLLYYFLRLRKYN